MGDIRSVSLSISRRETNTPISDKVEDNIPNVVGESLNGDF
jgi:hypothetical protein